MKKIPKAWLDQLNSERREQFECDGVETVRYKMLEDLYGSKEAKLAAKAWLAENNFKDLAVAKNRYQIGILIGLLGLLASIIPNIPYISNLVK